MNVKSIQGNIYGGITAGIIALPLALAFGAASGLGAAAGLWGAIIVSLVATIFGGTPTQISGPTGPMTVVVASIVLTHPNDPDLIFMTILLAGLFQIVLGFLKVGKFVNYVPYPVISGFMSGIGAIIILLQLNPLISVTFEGAPARHLLNFFKSLGSVDLHSLLLGAIALLIVFFTPKKISSKIPAPLIALVVGTLIAVVFHFDVKTIGQIPAAFPAFHFPEFSLERLDLALPLALTLGLLGSIDSLLTSLVADSLTKTKHDSNRELFGQGLGNAAAALFGGLAGAGATMRTVVNIKSGGTSRFSGVMHSVFLILAVILFAPIASKIPLAVLAGILVKVGVDIIDYKFLKIIKFAPKSDLAVMLFVFLITVLDDLIFAVGVGIILSSVLFAVNMAKKTEIKITDGSLEAEEAGKILVLHINGVFFFGTASQMLARVESLMETEHVIIDCKNIEQMDVSAVFALEDMIVRLKDHGIKVSLVLNGRKTAGEILRLGLFKFIKKSEIFFDLDKAFLKAKN